MPFVVTILFLHTISFSLQCTPLACPFGIGGCYPAARPLICPVCTAGFFCAPTGVCVSRARLHSALTQDGSSADLLEDPASIEVANKEFRTCCELSALPDACLSKCSYNEYKKRNAQSIALGLDACPPSALPILHACAAHHSDHKKCCLEKSIFAESLNYKCSEICKANVNSMIRLDISYLPCFDNFDRLVSDCFRNYTLKISSDF